MQNIRQNDIILEFENKNKINRYKFTEYKIFQQKFEFEEKYILGFCFQDIYEMNQLTIKGQNFFLGNMFLYKTEPLRVTILTLNSKNLLLSKEILKVIDPNTLKLLILEDVYDESMVAYGFNDYFPNLHSLYLLTKSNKYDVNLLNVFQSCKKIKQLRYLDIQDREIIENLCMESLRILYTHVKIITNDIFKNEIFKNEELVCDLFSFLPITIIHLSVPQSISENYLKKIKFSIYHQIEIVFPFKSFLQGELQIVKNKNRLGLFWTVYYCGNYETGTPPMLPLDILKEHL